MKRLDLLLAMAAASCILLVGCISAKDDITTYTTPTAESEEDITYFGDEAFQRNMAEIITDGTLTSSKAGRTFYVSPDGQGGDGTKENPFHSLNEAVSHLEKGDTLYLMGGIYKESLELNQLLGDADHYITITAAPNQTPVLDGSGKEGPVMVTIDQCAYLQISGLEIQNANGLDSCGIYVTAGSNHLIINDNHIHDITVPEPNNQDNCANAMLLMGDSAEKNLNDVLIYHNVIENCATGWSECISVAGHTENINVVSNTISNTGNIGIDFTGNYGYCSNPALDFPVNCLAYDNQVSDCISGYATSYGLYVDGGQHIQFIDNTIKGCSGGIEIGAEEPQQSEAYATADILVQGNAISDCIEAAITIGGYEETLGLVKNVTVTGNTCLNNGNDSEDMAILTLSKCKNITLTDNIFVNETGSSMIVSSSMDSSLTSEIHFDGNTYGNANPANKTNLSFVGKNYSDFNTWAAAVGEKNGIYTSDIPASAKIDER